jgi:type III secretion protein R
MNESSPVSLALVLGALSLAPFFLIMLTSFVKITVVLSLLRNALGVQSVPPNPVITGLALILSVFVMAPVIRQSLEAAGGAEVIERKAGQGVRAVLELGNAAKEPMRAFLTQHAHAPDRALFLELAASLERGATARAEKAGLSPRLVLASQAAPPEKSDFQVLVPAFVTSQLKEAFQVGFLLFVPFLVIDMIVANVLLAMGMSMLSPSVISLPFKLLLFVLVDGWYLVVRGLVLSYA